MKYEFGHIYGNRIDEIADFRKKNGRIVAEKYLKFIINKYSMVVNEIDLKYSLARPSHPKGDTPLHRAAMHGHADIFSSLVLASKYNDTESAHTF
jgi:hypothetical protein